MKFINKLIGPIKGMVDFLGKEIMVFIAFHHASGFEIADIHKVLSKVK